MVTYITMAIGALGVGLLAGLTGAMPSPQALRSQSDETWPPEPEMDTPSASPVGITLPQLPREILDALAEARRLGERCRYGYTTIMMPEGQFPVSSRTNPQPDVAVY